MSDPAIEAAQRAWIEIVHNDAAFDLNDFECLELVSAAREALKPIRELHRRDTVKVAICQEDCDIHVDADCPTDFDFDVCWECYRFAKDEIDPYFGEADMQPVAWPCATARLIYASEELP